ncbi:MAG TPA: HNH endonuclease [Candidatus Polarisedimenticolia bacterium]|nr:HNH endonuclease [Candidatus Polarisedimenticolia bacterium]
MRFWIGVTDNEWFDFLARFKPDEVNFWRPSGRGFSSIEIGAPFLFKLHSPLNFIVGGGFFVRSERLPLSLAWEAFGEKNGAGSLTDVATLIQKHRGSRDIDPEIGCIILNQPFFIPRANWIPASADFSRNIVVGKTYDSTETSGARVWEAVKPWLPIFEPAEAGVAVEPRVGEPQRLFGKEYLHRSRLGQGAFRILVTDAYERRCTISGERTLPVLQASHIKPYGKGPNRVDNGLLLRSDLHILFDRGYVTVTPELHVEVSPRIKEEFENGRDYYKHHGHPLAVLPTARDDRPNPAFLQWHNEMVFRG